MLQRLMPSRSTGTEPRGSLGRRLAMILVPLILIPMLIVVVFTYQRARGILHQQAIDQLTSAAQSQITVLTEWAETREQSLSIGSQRSALRESLAALIEASNVARVSSLTRTIARDELESLKTRQGQVIFVDVLVARVSDGMILASSQEDWEGQALPSLLDGSLASETIQSKSIFGDPILAADTLAIVSIVPLRSAGGAQIDSLLIGVNSGLRIGGLMQDMQVFWEERGVYRVERGETYMVYAPDVILRMERYGTSPLIETGVDHPVFSSAESSPSGLVEYSGTEGEAVLAGYEWLPAWNLGVVVELPQTDIFAGINALAPFAALLVAIAAIISVIVVLFTSNRLLRPLTDLTEFAQRMSRGDWLYRASEDRNDEVGMLAASLNRMGEDLSNLYQSLEDRVEERTRQVRTAAEVARVVISSPSLEDLLRSAVELIKSQFGYYHVSIFLLDEEGKYAELAESTGDIGQALKARRHRLEVGSQSVIGWVTANNQPRIASDVSRDAIHYKNELLPETRSEAAVPLQVGGRVLGALDVQSTEPEAFTQQDIEILQTLSDQLCAAIQNARLAAISTTAAERARLISEMTREMSGMMDVEEVMQTAASALHRVLGQPEIVVRLHSPDDWASFYAEQPTETVTE